MGAYPSAYIVRCSVTVSLGPAVVPFDVPAMACAPQRSSSRSMSCSEEDAVVVVVVLVDVPVMACTPQRSSSRSM